MYTKRTAREILCFASASEDIFAANTVLLEKDSHAIVVTPNYQSHETLPVAICAATGIPLDPDDEWSLDIDRVASGHGPGIYRFSLLN
jgi:aspartate/methionine/tyrosine aminotransferase